MQKETNDSSSAAVRPSDLSFIPAFARSRWDWKGILLFNIMAGLLVISWNYEPVRVFWDAIDEEVFFILNGLLMSSEKWQLPAAISNTKRYDKISAIILIALLGIYAIAEKENGFTWRLSAVIFLGLYMLIFVYGRRKLGLFEFDRASPSMVLEPFYDLREAFPHKKPKVKAHSSFPSDHGAAVLVYGMMFWVIARKPWKIAVVAIMPFFIFPRMIGGAHWFTDVFVGSLCFALVVASLALHTPIFARSTCAIERMIARLLKHTEKYLPPQFHRAQG